MKVINIGRVPPPIGGVSYFLKRLKPYLDEAGVENETYDISGLEPDEKKREGVIPSSPLHVLFKVFFQQRAIVVFHSNRLPVLIMASILSTRHIICILSHGESLLKDKNRTGFRYCLLKRVHYFLVPTTELELRFRDSFPALKDRVSYMPFILYPKVIPDINIPSVLELKKRTDYLLSAYAYQLSFYKGTDLYGVDMMVELMNRLKNKGFNIGLALILPDCTNENYYKVLLDKMEEYQLRESISIIRHPLVEASSLYRISDIYIRPTNTDGDSFSIWEALYCGTPVVTSDATMRPDGCVVFRNRDLDDFYNKVINVLLDLDTFKSRINALHIKGSEKGLIDFWKHLE